MKEPDIPWKMFDRDDSEANHFTMSAHAYTALVVVCDESRSCCGESKEYTVSSWNQLHEKQAPN